jgi:hypothetical protein
MGYLEITVSLIEEVLEVERAGSLAMLSTIGIRETQTIAPSVDIMEYLRIYLN